MEAFMARLRRVHNHEVSIEALIETAMWLVAPYLVIGLVWAFLHAERVERLHTQLNAVLPAGSDVAAYVGAALLWPVLLLLPPVCIV